MLIQLSLKEKKVVLVLFNNSGKKIDEQKWIDENDLLEKFFPILDEMLKRNYISIIDIDKFVLKNNIPAGYTTARIAQTIIKALNFAQIS